jgi:hypothetical protein
MLKAQRYVSRELTHFVGRTLTTDEEKYALLVRILREGALKPSHVLTGGLKVSVNRKVSDGGMFSDSVTCFCDIPLDDLEIHMAKYSRFGLSFLRSYLLEKGANPVFYVANESVVYWSDISMLLMEPDGVVEIPPTAAANRVKTTRSKLFDQMAAEYIGTFGKIRFIAEPDFSRLRQIERFLGFHIFSFIKPFDSLKAETDPENFYMEREWRLLGWLQFNSTDVHRVILPESFARRFRGDMPEYFGQLSFAE